MILALQSTHKAIFYSDSNELHMRTVKLGPNTHMLVDKLLIVEPRLAYIHVVRSGVDMAFSDNQNQLRLWGPLALGNQYEDSPNGSLRFWCWSNERVLKISEDHPGRVLMVSFERLCRAPAESIQRIAAFLQQDLTSDLLSRLVRQIKPPNTLNRSALHPADFLSSSLRSRASEIDALLKGACAAVVQGSGWRAW
jgi:Sulfotransferase domain